MILVSPPLAREPSHPVVPRATLGGLLSFGAEPSVSAGLTASFGLRWRAVSLALEGRADLSSSTPAQLAPQRPEMKVLFASGYTDDAIVHHGVLDAGIAFLQKPFTSDVILRRVREVLDASDRRAGGPAGR